MNTQLNIIFDYMLNNNSGFNARSALCDVDNPDYPYLSEVFLGNLFKSRATVQNVST